MKFPVYKKDGSKSSETVEIPDTLIKGEPNEHAIWLAVRSEEAAKHQGTHSTKSRGMVRGGGKKPFRQKGRGVARQGTTRSPLFPGGGKIFGPQPHKYSVTVPIKVKRLARASVIVMKMQSEGIRIIEDFTMELPKTSEMAGVFKALGVDDQKILLLTSEFDHMISRSVRNLPRASTQKASNASTRDLMDCSTIVLQKSAVEKLVKVLTNAA